jgi:hypothetical protein
MQLQIQNDFCKLKINASQCRLAVPVQIINDRMCDRQAKSRDSSLPGLPLLKIIFDCFADICASWDVKASQSQAISSNYPLQSIDIYTEFSSN